MLLEKITELGKKVDSLINTKATDKIKEVF
jgi:hypothetical protein